MIIIRFRIHLEKYEINEFLRSGVLFNRWLPNGAADAIDIPVKHTANKLRIWFERKGYLQNSFIVFDSLRSEVDQGIMARQGKLDAGPLLGEAVFTNVTDEELKAVKENRLGSDEYIALGKRIIEFLYPPLSNFISVLRTQYGPYWLSELNAWDSRRQSLGDYCRSTLGLYWSEDGKQWNQFAPTGLQVTINVLKLPGRGYEEYLTRADWERLSTSFKPYEPPSLATIILGRANEYYDSGEIEQSFIEGVTALEVVLSEYIGKKLVSEPHMSVAASNILNDPKIGVQEKFTWVSLTSGSISDESFTRTIEAIKIRNDIVHRGAKPNPSCESVLRILFETVRIFLNLDEYKFPVLTASNKLDAPKKQINDSKPGL